MPHRYSLHDLHDLIHGVMNDTLESDMLSLLAGVSGPHARCVLAGYYLSNGFTWKWLSFTHLPKCP